MNFATFTTDAIVPLVPLLVVLATALSLLLFEVFSVGRDRQWAASLAVVGLAVSVVVSLNLALRPAASLFVVSGRGWLVADPLAHVSAAIVATAALISALLSPSYIKEFGANHAEYYALMLFAVSGMMVMTLSADLFTLFLGIELMSIAVYVLTGLRKNDARSSEAALKYFLMGAFSTGFLLFGIALVFGATGSTHLSMLTKVVHAPNDTAMASIGVALIMVGMAFKIAAVPFHLWAPDVYEGAPTPITGFMAVGVKAATFLSLVRIVIAATPTTAIPPDQGADYYAILVPLLTTLSYATIIGGNVLAAVQRNVKRMLAYSSIAHAGYALMGVVSIAKGDKGAVGAVLFYMAAYASMTLGAFGVLGMCEKKDVGREGERYGAFSGIGLRHPALGAAMSLFMVALAGMPLTGGFIGKLYIFTSALKTQDYGLVVAGILGSAVSVYYYLRVLVAFYMREKADPGPVVTPEFSRPVVIAIALSAVLVVALGVAPSTLMGVGGAIATAIRPGL